MDHERPPHPAPADLALRMRDSLDGLLDYTLGAAAARGWDSVEILPPEPGDLGGRRSDEAPVRLALVHGKKAVNA